MVGTGQARCYAQPKAVAPMTAVRGSLDAWLHRRRGYGACAALFGAIALGPQWAGGTAPEVSPPAAPAPNAAPIEVLADIMVEAPEPRYVSPTRRDQIGRIWAPVMINGHGPFRLVLDTGASHSAVTALVALALGIPTNESPPGIWPATRPSCPSCPMPWAGRRAFSAPKVWRASGYSSTFVTIKSSSHIR